MLECVVNVSEGRRPGVLERARRLPPGHDLLDLHRDPDHHRAVLTLVGEDAPRAVAAEAVARLDLRGARGRPPPPGRGGRRALRPARRVDDGRRGGGARRLRGVGRRRAGGALLPVRAGPRATPTLPGAAARSAWTDAGARLSARRRPHPTAGAICVGARAPCWWPTTCGWPAATSGRRARWRRRSVGPAHPGPRAGRRRSRAGEHEPGRPASSSARPPPTTWSDGAPRPRSTAPSWSASCPRRVLRAVPRGALAGARSGRRPHDRGPAGAARSAVTRAQAC